MIKSSIVQVSSNLTFVPFSLVKTKPTPSPDTIQFVDQSSHYAKCPPPTQHVKTTNIHTSPMLSSQNLSNSPSVGSSPILIHGLNMPPKHDCRRASVCSISASITSNSSASDNSTDSSHLSPNTKSKQTLESQTFQFRVHEKEQTKLVFFNFVTKEQIEKKRKYVRKKPVTVIQTSDPQQDSPFCGKRNSEHVNYQSTDNNTPLTASICTIPTSTNLTLSPKPKPFFVPSKRRTSISIAELLN